MCIHELGEKRLVGGKIQVDSIDISRLAEQRKQPRDHRLQQR